MHRDTYASHIGHEDMLYFVSVADNESVERVRYTMLEVGIAYRIQDRKCCSPVDPLPQSPTPCTECVSCLFCLLLFLYLVNGMHSAYTRGSEVL